MNGRLAWLLEDMGFLLPPFLALEDTLGRARSLMISSLSLFTKHRDSLSNFFREEGNT